MPSGGSTRPTSEVLTEGVEVDGSLVGVRTGSDGAQSVVALDPRTGADRWSTPLTDADTVLAQRGARSSVSSCLPVPGARTTPSRSSPAWCPTPC